LTWKKGVPKLDVGRIVLWWRVQVAKLIWLFEMGQEFCHDPTLSFFLPGI
jgi:hypothetical protein